MAVLRRCAIFLKKSVCAGQACGMIRVESPHFGGTMARGRIHHALRYMYGLFGRDAPAARDDRDLLEAFAVRRDEAAFAALVERHGPLVWGVCRRVLAHEQDAEDAFQATFLVLARKAGSVPWRTDVGNWLYAVAVRVARRAKGRSERQRLRGRAAV